jgi:hypothetical protein
MAETVITVIPCLLALYSPERCERQEFHHPNTAMGVASREDWGILEPLIIGEIVALVSNAITDFIELEIIR